MIKVLIVSELIPESTTFAVVDMTKEEHEMFGKANGYCVNGDEFDEEKVGLVVALQDSLATEPELATYQSTAVAKKYRGKWANCVAENLQDISEVQAILRVSFYL